MQVLSSTLSLPLYGIAATRRLEQAAAATLPAHSLMQRAGLAAARLSLALAPHAQHIWIACGPGNNGGDGLEAAMHLHQWGKKVSVTWLGARDTSRVPADALASHARAQAAGVAFAEAPPTGFDFALDALLGIGATPRPSDTGTDRLSQWLALLRGSPQPVLALDIPSLLDADTGTDLAIESIAANAYQQRAKDRFTLTFLTVKPGLFTGRGRDLAGQIWWDDLGVTPGDMPAPDPAPQAWLLGRDRVGRPARDRAPHASHKGSFGDVVILGGESGGATQMAGAALLAGRAALHAGAGRVFVALLGQAGLTVDPQQPELMFRSPAALDFSQQVVVCGCGGGDAVAGVLPRALSSAAALVLDADALNVISRDTQLQALLRARRGRAYRTVLTPHPLEAARLLGCSAGSVQADRFGAAHQLAEQFQCVVVLKGSGSVIAAPGEMALVNPTGNARLATAGTGDVLAGMLGALLAGGQTALDAACNAVFQHGLLADNWALYHPGQVLTAGLLAQNHQAYL